MTWKVDFKELMPFLGKTIYKPENVLVELCANSYDADASLVEISTKGESRQILIKDDGSGMDFYQERGQERFNYFCFCSTVFLFRSHY